MGAKDVDVQDWRTELLTKLASSTQKFSHWRESDVTYMCKVRMKDIEQCRVIPFLNTMLQLFKHQMPISVLH